MRGAAAHLHVPYVATFKAGDFDSNLISMHAIYGDRVADRESEIRALEDVFRQVQDGDVTENDVILLGDFNLSPDHEYWSDLKTLESIAFLISPPSKTTIGKSGMASLYDNIWFQEDYTEYEYTGSCGVDKFFDDLFDSEKFENAKKYVSDHVPVWAEFRVDQEDDD